MHGGDRLVQPNVLWSVETVMCGQAKLGGLVAGGIGGIIVAGTGKLSIVICAY